MPPEEFIYPVPRLGPNTEFKFVSTLQRDSNQKSSGNDVSNIAPRIAESFHGTKDAEFDVVEKRYYCPYPACPKVFMLSAIWQ
jgi:hypothetical protein